MKVILCDDVDNLGAMGNTVNVAPGYARNFLFPRRLAVPMQSASAKQIEHEMRIIGKREEKKRAEMTEYAKAFETLTIELSSKAGPEGKLFGSVTTLHLAAKLAELGHEVDRRKIKLAEPIKTVGEHEATVNLGAGVEAKLKISVAGEVPEVETVVDEIVDTDDEASSMAAAEASVKPKSRPKAAAPAEETPEEAPAATEETADTADTAAPEAAEEEGAPG